MSLGPSGIAYGRAVSQFDIQPVGAAAFSMIDTSLGKAPIKTQASGRLRHRVAVNGEGEFVHTSYGMAIGMVAGDSVLFDHLSPDDVNLAKDALKAIRSAIKALHDTLGHIPLIRLLVKVLKWIEEKLNIGLNMSTSAAGALTVEMCGNKKTSSFKTSLVDKHDDKGNETESSNLRDDPEYVLLECKDNPTKIELRYTNIQGSKAHSTGLRGAALSSSGNLWMYLTLMCCDVPETGHHDDKFSYAWDDSFFEFTDSQIAFMESTHQGTVFFARNKLHIELARNFNSATDAIKAAMEKKDCDLAVAIAKKFTEDAESLLKDFKDSVPQLPR